MKYLSFVDNKVRKWESCPRFSVRTNELGTPTLHAHFPIVAVPERLLSSFLQPRQSVAPCNSKRNGGFSMVSFSLFVLISVCVLSVNICTKIRQFAQKLGSDCLLFRQMTPNRHDSQIDQKTVALLAKKPSYRHNSDAFRTKLLFPHSAPFSGEYSTVVFLTRGCASYQQQNRSKSENRVQTPESHF